MASFSDQGFRCFVVVLLTAVAYYLLVVNMSPAPTLLKTSSLIRSESCDTQFPQNNSADMYGRIFANGNPSWAGVFASHAAAFPEANRIPMEIAQLC